MLSFFKIISHSDSIEYIMKENEVTIYADETFWSEDDVIALGFVVIDSDKNLKLIKREIQSIEQDPVYKIYKGKRGKRHFASLTNSQKTHIINCLRSLPLSVYFFIDEDLQGQNQEQRKLNTYKNGLIPILKPLSSKYKKRTEDLKINLFFENLTDNTNQDKKFFISCLEKLNHECLCEVEVVGKNDVFNILPDLFLGILNSMVNLEQGHTFARQNMEVVKEKIGLVHVHDKSGEIRYERGKDIELFIDNFTSSASMDLQDPGPSA